MSASAPLPHRTVPFYDDELVAVQQDDGAIFVLFSRVCEALGLKRWSQVRRVQHHAVLNTGLVTLLIQTEGGPQETQCLRLDLLPLWLAGVQASRVKPELQAKLVRYQTEAAVVLWQAFKPQMLVAEPDTEVTTPRPATHQLQYIAEVGRAITRLAEQQLVLEQEQQGLATRMDSAARVIRDVQVRLGVLEEQVHPSAYVTDTQAAEISNQVKALADLLTTRAPGKNQYQSIFAELYRRFGVSSYKLIRQEHYAAVLHFLEEWRRTHSE